MDTGGVHPMNIDEESDDSVEKIGNPTQLEGVASTSRPKKRKRKLTSSVWNYFQLIDQDLKKPDQPLQCRCKKCSKIYSAESSGGTGVRDVFKYLERDVIHITRNTTKTDMLKLHGVESEWDKAEKICDFFKELESLDEYMKKIAKQMWLKFNKYAKLCGKESEQLAKVKKVLYGVFDEYNITSKNVTSSTSGGGRNMNDEVNTGDEGTSQRV
nr:putative zinc finger, BED-type [Tanacetum cinerariifolium]